MFGIERVKQAIESNLPAVYLWYGEDRFLIQEALKVIKKHFLKEDPSGSNIEVVSAREMPPLAIVERANTFSFFSGHLVIVENIPYFQENEGQDLQPLIEYMLNPNPQTCLLFWAESVHKGRKFYKALEKNGVVIEFALPRKAYEWQAWLAEELRVRNKTMDSGTAERFLARVGHQPGILVSELDKLVAYIGEQQKITLRDIDEITNTHVEASIFDLLDAVGQRSASKAVGKLQEILQEEYPLKILATLSGHLRLLLGALSWRRRGGNGTELASALGINPYRAQKVWQQSAKLSENYLIEALTLCLDTELAIKRSKGEPALLLEMMVMKFCLD